MDAVLPKTFKNAICIFCFLLLAELKTILGGLATAIGAMLSRRIVFLCQNFVIAEDRFTELKGEESNPSDNNRDNKHYNQQSPQA